MDQKPRSSSDQQNDPQKLIYVLLVVLIICGGNGVGILTAGLIWKLTGAIGIAVLAAVIITIAAFTAAMLLMIYHGKKH